MPASKDGTRRLFSATFKVGVLDELAKDDAPPASQVAAKHGIGGNLLYVWKHNEAKLRRLAEREAKAEAKAAKKVEKTLVSPSNGHAKPEPVEKTPALQIVGLTPLIRALVKEELDKVLGPMVATQLGDTVAKQISEKFKTTN